MGVNARMVATMMSDAGLDNSAIADALASLRPIATFDGAPYYCPTKVSRLISKLVA